MKRIPILLLASALSISMIQAQNSKITTAANAMVSGDLLSAKKAIDEASLHEKTSLEAKTWYMRGQIHNAIAMDTTGATASVADPLGIALESFQKALTVEDGAKNFRIKIATELLTTYNLYFQKGAIAYNAGNFEEAYKYFSKAAEANSLQIEANPLSALDTGVIFNVGLMAEKTNRMNEAIAAFQRLVDIKYSEAYLYSRLSTLYLENGDPVNALKVLETGRTNYPGDKDIMVAELNFYLAQNKLGDLVGKLENAIKMDPKNAELYFVLGTTHGELIKLDSLNAQQHIDAAIKAYDAALGIDKNRYDINLNAGALFYNTAIEINKKMNALPLEKEAEYEKLKNERNKLYGQALPYFESAHQIDPKNTDCMLALKEIYVRLGQTEKADEMKKQLGQ